MFVMYSRFSKEEPPSGFANKLLLLLLHSDMIFFFRLSGALSSGDLLCSLSLVFLSCVLKLASKPSRDLAIKSLYSLITLSLELNLCLEMTTSNISLLSRYGFLQLMFNKIGP